MVRISTLGAKRCVFATFREASRSEALAWACGGVRGTPISTLRAKRCVFATFRVASRGQRPALAWPCGQAKAWGSGGLHFQHLERNVAFSQRFGRPPEVKGLKALAWSGFQRPEGLSLVRISTLRARRCVFATFREASGGQRPALAWPCGGVRGTPVSTLRAKRCVFATFRSAS